MCASRWDHGYAPGDDPAASGARARFLLAMNLALSLVTFLVALSTLKRLEFACFRPYCCS